MSSDTVLVFQQAGDVVWARYRGGPIVEGHLVGRLAGNSLQFRYVQADTEGRLDAGTSDGLVECLPDGRYQLIERFQWTTRPESGTNVFEEIAGADGTVQIAIETPERTRTEAPAFRRD